MLRLTRGLLLAGAMFSGGLASASELGTVTIAINDSFVTLDASKYDTTPHRMIFKHVFDPLLGRGEDGKPEPFLAESYEQVDSQTIRLKLRQGVKFHNGEAFNAESVRYTLQQMKLPGTQSAAAVTAFSEVKIIDDYTVDFISVAPNALGLNLITEYVYPVPPKHHAAVGMEAFAKEPVGTGPYKFVSWRQGDRVTLAANTEWWRGVPKADEVVFWTVPENGTRVSALLNGQADVATGIPAIDVARVESSGEARIEVADKGLLPTWGGLIMDRPVFKDKRMREAVNYAVNKQVIVERLLQGYARLMSQPCTADVECFDPSVEPFPYDPEKAKQLIKDAGMEGATVKIDVARGWVPQAQEVGQAIAADLQRVGLKTELNLVETSVFIKNLFDSDNRHQNLGDMFVMYYKSGFTSPRIMRTMTDAKYQPTLTWNHYDNAHVSALWTQAWGEIDTDKRVAILREISRTVREDAAWLFLYEPYALWGVSNRLKWTKNSEDVLPYVENMSKAQ